MDNTIYINNNIPAQTNTIMLGYNNTVIGYGDVGQFGPIGPIGVMGPMGEIGATGPTGPTGCTGPSNISWEPPAAHPVTVRCTEYILNNTNNGQQYEFMVDDDCLHISSENKDARLLFNGRDVFNEIDELKKKFEELFAHVQYMPDGPGYVLAKQEFEGLNKNKN